MVIFKNIVHYPLSTTLVAQTMVFPITEGPLLITNLVAMLAPLSSRPFQAIRG